ncbi:SusC/RagA family TonB-linked outer membrane protein [Chitinophaga nivalis]|uniref:SusC/RagA family TonB-linked outer membrane protein n=1 Tax=Chitinophaga nivalis TaxID=2991709 RepID=A0ABT3IHZ0_9BACT|nr:SusC/RagA family TonB-linked outer membrane protein [Chitinophaga nivalis]MCW3466731.1 SusC/RagA family TonB-linked outer membrane protein [Chitinophaga nivalis]MCW3483578.1 SusC/RagA family TonB-linked outer membrane protein [Chitinophaga nivalis]
MTTTICSTYVSKTKYCLLAVFFAWTTNAYAQSGHVSGTVKDADGLTLPGATVKLKGTNKATLSGQDGKYDLAIDRLFNAKDTLEFSYVGYAKAMKPWQVSGIVDVVLRTDGKQLNALVVTALGIKRDQMALGYSTQTIGDKQVNDARSNNWVSALSGKVAGLTLVSPGSGPVNSTNIILRGDRSMKAGGNNALIIVDGTPINTAITSSGVSNAYQASSGNDLPIDFGNGINDINPDDIESITVLKGAGATALYGSRAANGALVITTKSGAKKNKSLGVTVNSNIAVNDILKWPDYQYEYGQGTGTSGKPNSDLYYSYGKSADGVANHSTSSAFGPKFNGQYYFQYDPEVEGQSPERREWRAYKDNVKGFFRNGYTLTNSVSMEKGGTKANGRASITHSKNEWIMPNTGFERLSAALSGNYNVTSKLKISAKGTYTGKKSDNLPATGYNNHSISYFMIFQNPNVDLNWYRRYWKKGKEQVDQVHPFSSYIDNPYLIAYEMTNSVRSANVVGNLSATYSFNKNLDLMVRTALNLVDEDRAQRRPLSTQNFGKGYYKEQSINSYELNTDFLLTWRHAFSQKFKLSTSGGGNAQRNRYTAQNAYINGLATPGEYGLDKGLYPAIARQVNADKNVNSLYAFANLSYDDKIFLDVTGRNDWSSTLPANNNSFFYPSVSTSVILSKLLHLPKAIDYAKLRMSFAQLGNDTDPYGVDKYFRTNDFPGSVSSSGTLYNTNLKPEISNSFETGMEFQLLKNRLGMDVTYYRTNTRNQILEAALDLSTGYNKAWINSGLVRNAGVELMLNGKPINNKNFKWNTTITWAKNTNKVLELAAGTVDQQLIGTGGEASIIAKVGGSTGDIYGFGFLKTPDGQIIYNKDGVPARPAQVQYIGRAFADWKGGISNEFTYKNLRFSFLIDGQYGGMIYSQTHHKMSEQGKLTNTLAGREEGVIVGQGVVVNPDGSYSPNTKKVAVADYYDEYYRRANVEANSFDASFLKLREVRLEYNLSKRLLNKTKFNQISVAFYGRDLAMLTSFPMFDPETAAMNGSSILPGVEMGQMPSTRTFGMNITLKL